MSATAPTSAPASESTSSMSALRSGARELKRRVWVERRPLKARPSAAAS